MQLTRLRVLHMENSLGIDENPWYSWVLKSEKPDTMQTGYRIRVTEEAGNPVWDSGMQTGDENTFIPYEGAPLKSRTRYSWTVEVTSNHGETASETGVFETAFLGDDAWTAQWVESTLPVIERKSGFGNQPPATMFRRFFELNAAKRIASARLYATALGVYRLYVNGSRVDERELAPGYSSYDALLNYQTYDVTPMLKSGGNAVGMYVGDGWYFNPETTIHKDVTGTGRHAVCFELIVRYEDDSEERIISDGQVKVAVGPVVFSDLFSGERYDARRCRPDWCNADSSDDGWIFARVRQRPDCALKSVPDDVILPVKSFPVKRLFHAPNGDLIADFGQNIAGSVWLRMALPTGMMISLEHFEALGSDGNYFNTIYATGGVGNGADQRVEYVSDGSDADYQPHFTFLGFRYVRVRFYDEAGTELTGENQPAINPENLTAVALSTKKENLGVFACSHEGLNRLYENIRWSQYSNMISIPTDCPQREKAGWTGDAGIYIETALLNEDVTPFFSRWLRNVSADQQADGAVPMVVPFNDTYRAMSQMMAQMFQTEGLLAPAGWGDASVKIPWTMYKVTGNRRILEAQYDSMKRWCDYIIRTAEKCGRPDLPPEKERYLWNTGFHYGEWLIPSTTQGGFEDQASIARAMMETGGYVAPIFGWYSVSTFAGIAAMLGNTEDAGHYSAIACKMREAIQSCLIGPNGEAPAEYMGAYVLLLYFDLVPERFRDRCANHLLDMIRQNGNCLDTGFLATPYLLPTLEKIGRTDIAFELLFQNRAPSWLYEVEHGATTIWETWTAVGEDGQPQHVSMNHYSFGCVAEWMFRAIGGVDADKPGFKHLVIAPKPDQRLDWARREYMSEQGTVGCAWEKKDDGIEIRVTIPCNARATILLPNGTKHEVGSGEYVYQG